MSVVSVVTEYTVIFALCQLLFTCPFSGPRFLPGLTSPLARLHSMVVCPTVLDFRRDKRSEEHTSELQSQSNLVCRLLLEKKKKINCKRSRPCEPRCRT